MSRFLSMLFAVPALALPSFAQTFTTFTVFDGSPDATFTDPRAINEVGDIVGTFGDPLLGTRAFILDKDGTITAFDGPGEDGPFPSDINSVGEIVGSIGPFGTGPAFVRYTNGLIIEIEFQGATQIQATAINSARTVTGWFTGQAGSVHGFIRHTGGETEIFDASQDGTLTQPEDINNRGQITGKVFDAAMGRVRGFIRDRKGGVTMFDADPAAKSTWPVAINASGAVAGSFTLSAAPNERGFLRFSDGRVLILENPSPSPLDVRVADINNARAVTGVFEVNNPAITLAFVQQRKEIFFLFSPPLYPTWVRPASLNNRGQVTGSFFDGDPDFPQPGQRLRGFLHSP